ncbi:MAG TPA: hypothetical protein VFW54_08950, partial [Propionibacteriaceae bacterium]|nr:hypothetical protein [Propionibacteriaceae bacterium]
TRRLHSTAAARAANIFADAIATSGILAPASFAPAIVPSAIAASGSLALAVSTAHRFAAAEATSCTGVTADASV